MGTQTAEETSQDQWLERQKQQKDVNKTSKVEQQPKITEEVVTSDADQELHLDEGMDVSAVLHWLYYEKAGEGDEDEDDEDDGEVDEQKEAEAAIRREEAKAINT